MGIEIIQSDQKNAKMYFFVQSIYMDPAVDPKQKYHNYFLD